MFDYLAHIKNRMKNLGFTHYDVKPIIVNVINGKVNITSKNEYYFLASKSLPASLKINDAFNSFEASSITIVAANLQVFHFQEFSGKQIKITATEVGQIEFLKVTPIGKKIHTHTQ